jgi:hypothetical protein
MAPAQRVIAGRSHHAVDDRVRVGGIGPRSLEGIRLFAVVTGETRRKEGESCVVVEARTAQEAPATGLL